MPDSRSATFDCCGTLADWNAGIQAEAEDAVGRSLPAWPVFPEVPGQLEKARRRGWPLVIVSNSDRDLLDPSIGEIVPAYELGIRSVWINQLGERAQPTPVRELPDRHGLGDVLDEPVATTAQRSLSPPC